jgi:hypothetical protein
MVRGLDSRDGSGGSPYSYEMVSPHDEDGGYFGTGTVSRNSGVLVEQQQQRSPPLAVVNHGRYNDGSQLDGGVDRTWECVSAADAAAAADDTRQEHDWGNIPASAQLHNMGTPHSQQQQHHSEEDIHPALRVHNRPSSAAGDIFKDFDGVHYSPDSAQLPPPTAQSQPEHRNYADQRRQSYATHNTPSESSRDSRLVYYPAPVPAVLNLPPLMTKDSRAHNRLTKMQKRASHQVLSGATPPGGGDNSNGTGNNRRSVAPHDAWAATTPTTPGNGAEHAAHHHHNEKRLSNLPPALRASAFFDSMQPTPQIMQGDLRDSSAVATLDSILDASANAPPAAFTDHPMTGADATTLLPPPRNEYRNSVAMTVTLHPGESLPASEVGEDNDHAPLRTSRSFEVPSNPTEGALPTTLLAELESRKQQQKSRNRTAASAFPTGIRSTLLELDAVAQVQAQSRRQKRTTLAWEDPDDAGNGDDEDVPLGMLYQGSSARPQHRGGKDEDVPLGLLMQKQMEDSEPLSRRRERLKGAHGTATSAPKIPPVEGIEEEETLAARMKRLKEEKEKEKDSIKNKRVSTFGDGGLDLNFDSPTAASQPAEEETLAQRRKRLREEEERRRLAEEARSVQAEVRKRNSMATLLQQQQMLGTGMIGRSTPMLPNQRPQSGLIQQAGVPHMLRPQMNMGNMPQMGMMNGGMGGAMGMGMMGGGMAQNQMMTPQEIAMNSKQREMVERWRASVM